LDHNIGQSLRQSSTLSFFPSLRPERKRGRGARFNRGGGHYPSLTRTLHANQTFANHLEHVVQSTLRDEQIMSDGTQFHADQHIAHITESGDHAILDTGASIPVIPPKVVDDLHLIAIDLESPIRVRMTNGSTEHIHKVVDLGPIIGHAAILPSATQTLIGLGPLMELGYEVHFSLSGVGLFLNSKLIYKGVYDRDRRLFQINLKDLKSFLYENFLTI
jgi:hypothetical protein